MSKEPLVIKKKKEKSFKDIVMEKLPDGGNLNACLTCGTVCGGLPGHRYAWHGSTQGGAYGGLGDG